MNSRKVTMRDIAKVAGVSLTTVFRALSPESPVSPTTRAKVIAAQQLLQRQSNYVQTEKQSVCTVGIIMPSSSASELQAHPSMFTVITSFIEEISQHGMSNSTIVYDEHSIPTINFLSNTIDAYLIVGTGEELEQSLIPALSEAHIPCVLINRQSDSPYVASVSIDDTGAAIKAVNHLLELGHERIAYIGGNKNYQNSKRRFYGYQQALDQRNVPISRELTFWGEYTEESGYQIAKELFSINPRPTACFCASDPIAIGLMRYCKEQGIEIPADFSVVGFGNIEISQYISPSLSTISQPSKETGILAAQIIIQMIENPIICSQRLILTTDLIVRNSTAIKNK